MVKLTSSERVRRARRLHLGSRLFPGSQLVVPVFLSVVGLAAICVTAAVVLRDAIAREQRFDSANCSMTDMGSVDRTVKEVMIKCMRFAWVPIDDQGVEYGRVQRVRPEAPDDGTSVKWVDIGVTGVVLSCRPGTQCPKAVPPAEKRARQQARMVIEAGKKRATSAPTKP